MSWILQNTRNFEFCKFASTEISTDWTPVTVAVYPNHLVNSSDKNEKEQTNCLNIRI